MNPTLSVEIDTAKKTLTTEGVVSVGEKVSVTVTGMPTMGSMLPRFRIVDECGHDLARYPLDENDTVTVTGSTWSFELNLDTDMMRRRFFGVCFRDKLKLGVVVDSWDDQAQYARGKVDVLQWAYASTQDPTLMPRWEDVFRKIADETASHYPYVGDRGTWMVWSSAGGKYVDSGINAIGVKGAKGDKGIRGDAGAPALLGYVRDESTNTWHKITCSKNSMGDRTVDIEDSDDPNPDQGDVFVKASGTTTGRALSDRFADVINVKDFGASGDGNTDDTEALQAAMDSAATSGGSVFIPSGRYMINGEAVTVPSNVEVFGCGTSTVLIQPNYYTYTNWNSADAVDYNCFRMECGTNNVTIRDMRLEGPFASDDYDSHPVESHPYNNGILVRGRDYQKRKGLALDGFSKNICIRNVNIEGFAEDGIQLDNVTEAWVTECLIERCGRGGVRVYGGYHCHVNCNNVRFISPGDALNERPSTSGGNVGGNRTYGITFTRVYKEGCRSSTHCEASHNVVYKSMYWKGLDTHGGQYINFMDNIVQDCHIGIGIDKGGYGKDDHGIAPPRYISVVGNTIIRNMADNPREGDYEKDHDTIAVEGVDNPYAVCGPAITVFAHNGDEEHIGKYIVVSNNLINGWGEMVRFGAVAYSHWEGITHSNNVIRNSRRAAINLAGVVSGTFSGDVIDGVRKVAFSESKNGTTTSYEVQCGIRMDSQTVSCNVSGMRFINRSGTEMTAIHNSRPAEGHFGMKVSDDNSFVNTLQNGSIKMIYSPANEAGLMKRRTIAAGSVVKSGGSWSFVGYGASSVTRSALGVFDIALESPASSVSTLWPVVTPVSTTTPIIANAVATNTGIVQVKCFNATDNTAFDGSFFVEILGY